MKTIKIKIYLKNKLKPILFEFEGETGKNCYDTILADVKNKDTSFLEIANIIINKSEIKYILF